MENTREFKKEQMDIRRKLDELRRITGLPLTIADAAGPADNVNGCSSENNSAAGAREEQVLYTIHQLDALIAAYKETNSREAVFKRWITGDMETHELIHTAKRFHVPLSACRALFLVESRDTMDSSVMTILQHAFPDSSQVWLVPMTSSQLAIVYTFSETVSEEEVRSTAYLVMDLLNAEALIQVKVSFSSVLEYLNQLPAACQEAGLALNAGKIFYPDQNVYPYNKLGIGRLIYGLSRERCSAYLKEVLGTDSPDFFQTETIHVINSFLDHNMNIAETTRHLHMHRNTLIYRLEQIQKETGLDIRQFHDAMTIKTVLFVLNYIDNSQSPAAESGQ